MNPLPRAVLFDVYRTLLDVCEAPPDAGRLWDDLCVSTFGAKAGRSLDEVSADCRVIVAGDHARALAEGIPFPEVDWPSVFSRAFRPARALDPPKLLDFLYHHAALRHSVRLMPGAAEYLRRCREEGVVCGIASNAQAYTVRELREALGTEGLDPGIFDRRLVFWSFENGFAKPDPRVFQILAARLAGLGIPPEEALVIGDREDNDIRPARPLKFQTYLFVPPPHGSGWPPNLSAKPGTGSNAPK